MKQAVVLLSSSLASHSCTFGNSTQHLQRLYITFAKSLLQYFKNMSLLRGSVNDFFFLSPDFIRGYKYPAPTGLASLFGNFTEHVKVSALLEFTKKNGVYEKHGLPYRRDKLCVVPLLQEQPSEVKVGNEVRDEVSIRHLRETFYLTKQ
jgi:hypothetical protein